MPAAELVHLLKAGRILQYRQQNVALVSSPEGAEFDITYADRWLAPGTEVHVGDGAVVFLADSPYKVVDPVRFATVTRADRTRSALEITIKVGPWPVVIDDAALAAPARPAGSNAPWFVWRSTAESLRNPRSDEEALDAWRGAVDRLHGNQFYAESRFAHLVRLSDPHGHEARGRGLIMGDTATAVIETRITSDGDHVHSVLVDTDPPGSVAGGIKDERVDDVGRLHVPMRPLSSGTHRVALSFVPDPLLSTRLSFDIDAHVAAVPERSTQPAPVVPSGETSVAGTGVDTVHVQALAQRLRRIDSLDPDQWLELLVDHLLPLAPEDAILRSMVGEAAFDLGDDRLVVDMLDDPSRFRTGDAFRALVAGLRFGAQTDVAGLLREIDLGTERNIAMLAKALPDLPAGAIRDVTEVILGELAGKEVLERLLPAVFSRFRDDLALRVAAECVAADPDAWLDRALRRWPDPSRIPRDALDEILRWEIRDAALAPYLREAIEIRVDDGDLEGVTELMARAEGLLPRAEMIRLRIATALMCFDDQGDLSKQMLLEVVGSAAGLGDPDLWSELAFTLREFWPAGVDEDVDSAIDRLGETLSDLEDFQQWREKRHAEDAAGLRSKTNGKVLHVVGGWRPSWADSFSDSLGLRDLRWHESERGDPPPMEWAGAVDSSRDIVLLLWTHCGHSTSRALNAAGVDYTPAVFGRASILTALRAGLLNRS